MKKRIVSVLLALVLVVCLLPTAAFAEGEIDTWDGTADESWYDPTKTEFHITTAEQLAGMAKLVNDDTATFKDKTVYLDNDLDLGGHEWISIGDGANTDVGSFQGVFDGQSHVIYNLYSHEGLKSENKDNNNNLYRNGLFGSIYNATVKNLGIENADIVIPMNDTSTYGKGILVDWMTDSIINNCYTTGSITGGSYIEKYIGGIAGFLNGKNSISQCYSTAAITGNYDGEYYAEQEGGLEPMDCWDSLGGIVGASYTGEVTIRDCWFDGKIVVNSIQAPVGGIIGYGEGVSMVNCLVATKEIGNDGWGNTCWLGYVTDTDAEYCFWPNDDKYDSNVANEASENSAGTAVDDFMAESVLKGLNAHAGEGVEWVEGMKHPVFSWDNKNFPTEPEQPTLPPILPGIIAGGASQMQRFVDVTSMDYYFDAVQWAADSGIATGTSNLMFSPDAPCTRAQAVTFLWRAMGSRRAEQAANFTDVAPDAYYADAVAWAVEKGITNGTSATTFSPDAPCTRSQIVTFLYRTIGVKSTVEAGFSDVAANAYYAEAVNWAAQYGITGGTGGNRFSPDMTCTRAQIVTFLYRAN